MLRESNGGEQTFAEGGERAEGVEAFPSALHEHEPSHNPHHVPAVRARGRLLLLLVLRRSRQPPPPPASAADQPVGGGCSPIVEEKGELTWI